MIKAYLLVKMDEHSLLESTNCCILQCLQFIFGGLVYTKVEGAESCRVDLVAPLCGCLRNWTW